MRLAFLGPAGTFSEEAALQYADDAELVPFASIPATAGAVLKGDADEAITPIENSLQGAVTDTLDVLIHEEGLHIRRELVIPIVHDLMVKPGTVLAAVRRVYSHPQALGQCQGYLERHLPGAEPAASLSTAAAVEQMMASDVPAAAIAPTRAAELYGAQVMASGIQGDDSNATRFVVLAKEDHPRTGNDLTSAAIAFAEDRPGQLHGVMGEFAQRNINLTKIESRPTRLGLGKYYFLVDFEGHRDDPPIREILERIAARASLLKVFGSYPRSTIGPYMAARVRENAALRGYRSRERVWYNGIEVGVVLDRGNEQVGVEIRASSSYEAALATAQRIKDAGLSRALLVFADAAVAAHAEEASRRQWGHALISFVGFTTPDRIGEFL